MTAINRITTAAQLDALYGEPVARSLTKEIDYISASYRKFIEAAPFVILATSGPEGLDCSPRGDPPGFLRVRDPNTVLIPDRRGNNRIDTLRNLVADPRISLLFLIPGVGETLRINGRAEIVTDPELRESFALNGKAPVSVLVVTARAGFTSSAPRPWCGRASGTRIRKFRAARCRAAAKSWRKLSAATTMPRRTTAPIRSASRRRSTN